MKVNKKWLWLLVLPFIGLAFPQWYNRETPILMGIPFFYWYQFAWIFVATALLGIYYFVSRDSA